MLEEEEAWSAYVRSMGRQDVADVDVGARRWIWRSKREERRGSMMLVMMRVSVRIRRGTRTSAEVWCCTGKAGVVGLCG